MEMRGLPRLPTIYDYWGVRAGQQQVPAQIVPDRVSEPTALPSMITSDSKAGVNFFVVLMLVIAGGVLLSYWVEKEL